MRSVLACACVFVIGACATAGSRSSGATITRLDGTTIDTTALTARIEALTRTANVQGLTVTIFNDAEKVYSRAFGVASLPAGKPLRTDTEIYGASLSKAVFSVLIMKLVEQGVLDLDKPLQDYVSEPLCQNRGTVWHEDLSDLCSDPRYRRITARMSMSHTTGLPNWRWFEPDQKLRIKFEPGERYSYSGEGMTFLQAVIQKITGKPLEELMQAQVFAPYGMTMSSYTWQPRFEADYAVGHASDGKAYPKDKDNAARAPSTLETTTDDYAKFMAAVLRRNGLSEASWNEIFKPQVRIRSKTQFGPGASETTAAYDPIELSYGLGWGLQRTPHGWGAFKEGHGDGFQHYSIVYPAKKLGVLLMSNSDNAESIFGHLLRLTIADTFTPLEWENYVPYDRAASGAQDAFWAALQSMCGQAYAGRLVEGNASDSAFRTSELRMHVRSCTPTEVRIPFHLGANRSRTWVITRTATGLRLKHDHRHEDGSEDAITQYGGDTRNAGTIARQEFYADSHTATLIPAARTNVWTIEVMPGDFFAYALRREGTDRRFRVEFDLTKPIAAPPPPWGR